MPDSDSITAGCHFIDTDKERMTINTDDGADISCAIIRIFHTPGHDYIVLLPEDGRTDGQAYLFRFALSPDGGPVLTNITSDEEYAHASAIFDALRNEIDFSE